MTKNKTLSACSSFLAAILLMVSFGASAKEGLISTHWPSADDPGMPFYARVELLPPYVFNDGEWAAIIFYREPSCVPANFNLIQFFDVPGAFFCPHTVQGHSLWDGSNMMVPPKIINITELASVPVWFVPWEAVQSEANAGGVITRASLEATPGLIKGYASHYKERLHPHPDFAGQGGNKNPKMIVTAKGDLEDGREFGLQIAWINDVVTNIRIDFK